MRDNASANAAAIHNDDRNQPPEPKAKRRGSIVADVELAAMNVIAGRLATLDADARQRVLAWVQARYCPATVAAGKVNPLHFENDVT